jgi:phosphatidylserine/phosphatidylglycerophosphate/cardiolipin synthase-like enzyme
MTLEVKFARGQSIAEVIESLVRMTTTSIDAALYRLNNPRLASALEEADRRGVAVRLVLDRGKYDATPVTRQLLAGSRLPFRLMHGHRGSRSKMHHKFVVLDRNTVLTGSYNWTVESEELNYENLLTLHDPATARGYTREFEALWAAAEAMQSLKYRGLH